MSFSAEHVFVVLGILYLISVRVIGIRIARLSWNVWTNARRDRTACLLFPVHALLGWTGQHTHQKVTSFLPIAECYSHFIGKGFGVWDPQPGAKQVYLVLTSLCWAPKLAINMAELIFIGVGWDAYRQIVMMVHWACSLALLLTGVRKEA